MVWSLEPPTPLTQSVLPERSTSRLSQRGNGSHTPPSVNWALTLQVPCHSLNRMKAGTSASTFSSTPPPEVGSQELTLLRQSLPSAGGDAGGPLPLFSALGMALSWRVAVPP